MDQEVTGTSDHRRSSVDDPDEHARQAKRDREEEEEDAASSSSFSGPSSSSSSSSSDASAVLNVADPGIGSVAYSSPIGADGDTGREPAQPVLLSQIFESPVAAPDEDGFASSLAPASEEGPPPLDLSSQPRVLDEVAVYPMATISSGSWSTYPPYTAYSTHSHPTCYCPTPMPAFSTAPSAAAYPHSYPGLGWPPPSPCGFGTGAGGLGAADGLAAVGWGPFLPPRTPPDSLANDLGSPSEHHVHTCYPCASSALHDQATSLLELPPGDSVDRDLPYMAPELLNGAPSSLPQYSSDPIPLSDVNDAGWHHDAFVHNIDPELGDTELPQRGDSSPLGPPLSSPGLPFGTAYEYPVDRLQDMGADTDWPTSCSVPHYMKVESPPESPAEAVAGVADFPSAAFRAQTDRRRLDSIERPGRKQRGALDEKSRRETNRVREIRPCVRCKRQAVRCSLDQNGNCLTCMKVVRSKKFIHDIPCRRWMVTDTTWFRKGGLQLTSRLDGLKTKDFKTWSWADDAVHEIDLKIFYSSPDQRYDLCDTPIRLRVRRFVPNKDDVLIRRWTKRIASESGTAKTEIKSVELPPFGLDDSEDATRRFRDYFEQCTPQALTNAIHKAEPAVRSTLRLAVDHYNNLPELHEERLFLAKLFTLWFMMRFTTGSDYISGQDKLGARPVDDPDYPLGEKISIPRMITAQMDYILVEKFLEPLSKDVLARLEALFQRNNPLSWLTIYVACFLLLHEVAFSSKDRRRHAIDNFAETRYTLPTFVEKLQHGANIILLNWHYYKTKDDPSSITWWKRRDKALETMRKGGKEPPPSFPREAIINHWVEMKRTTQGLDFHGMTDNRWEHPLYFVSQMYETQWTVRDNYKAPSG